MSSSKKGKKNNKSRMKKFKAAIYNKKLMLPILCVLGVSVITLTILLILDSTGALYKTDSGKYDSGASSVSSSAAKPIDGNKLTDGNYEYILLQDGTAELYYFSDAYATSVTVPSEVGGYPVSSIGEECFVWMATLNEITIPEGVVSIAPNAFEGCSYLYSVNLPSTLKTVADNAFLNCYSLIDVNYGGKTSELSIGIGNSYLKKCLQ